MANNITFDISNKNTKAASGDVADIGVVVDEIKVCADQLKANDATQTDCLNDIKSDTAAISDISTAVSTIETNTATLITNDATQTDCLNDIKSDTANISVLVTNDTLQIDLLNQIIQNQNNLDIRITTLETNQNTLIDCTDKIKSILDLQDSKIDKILTCVLEIKEAPVGGTVTPIKELVIVGHASGSQSTNTTLIARNASITRTNTGQYTVTFGTPHPDGANYEVIFGQDEDANRDVPKVSVVENTKTANGFDLVVTGDDNGGAADFYMDEPFSFEVLTEKLLVTDIEQN